MSEQKRYEAREIREMKEAPMERTNALADLAERMFKEVDGRRLIEPNREDYCKAQRIVAELAWACDNGNEGRPWMDVAQQTIMRCRLIAEEGAGQCKQV